jgi:hypothetical protein
MGRRKRAISEVYKELKDRANELAFNIIVEKTKSVVQNRRKRRISEILAIKDHDIEVVTSFTHLGTAIDNTNGESEELKARTLAANRACFYLQTIFVSKQFHRNNKIVL